MDYSEQNENEIEIELLQKKLQESKIESVKILQDRLTTLCVIEAFRRSDKSSREFEREKIIIGKPVR